MTFAEDDYIPFKQHMYVEDLPEAEDDTMIDAHHLKHRMLTLDSRKIGPVNPYFKHPSTQLTKPQTKVGRMTAHAGLSGQAGLEMGYVIS